MLLPSKELLSAVLNKDVCIVFSLLDTNLLIIEWNDNLGVNSEEFNIYELMHLMKEWLHSQLIVVEVTSGKASCHVKLQFIKDGKLQDQTFVNVNTEVEAVTKACEWRL